LHRVAAWLLLGTITLTAAWFALDRVQNGRLFLIRLPFDREPLAAERDDAARAAQTWKIPALAFLAVAACAIAASARSGPAEAARRLWERLRGFFRTHRWLCALFIIACTADFLSTAHYFHAHRVDDELHPAIKLVTYAFGLSIGCLLAKLIQALLALAICALFPKIARPVLVILIIAYSAATTWNLWLFW
jgi:hypothetical protein